MTEGTPIIQLTGGPELLTRRHSLFLFVAALAVSSCSVWSLHPAIPDPNDNPADPSPLLGSWEVLEALGREMEPPLVIEVFLERPGELQLISRSGSTVISRRALFVDLNGQQVVSIQNDTGSWNLVAVELDQSNVVLLVRSFNARILKEAVEAGELQARKPGMSFDGGEIEIFAPEADLARFLAENEQALGFEVARLRKVVP